MNKVRISHLEWVALEVLTVTDQAQRRFRPAHAKELALNFDLEKMGYLVVSHRDERYFIIDGQHRVAAARQFGFEPTDKFQCEVYEELTLEEEAEMFLARNDFKAVGAYDKFRVAITAGHEEEMDIDLAVRTQGLHISPIRKDNGISCVTTLKKAYALAGAAGIGTVLRIIRDAFGDSGFDAPVVSGINLCLHRYDGQVDEERAIERLSRINGGVTGLLAEARKTQLALGTPLDQCVAAAVVTAYNRGKTAKGRLPSWWKEA